MTDGKTLGPGGRRTPRPRKREAGLRLRRGEDLESAPRALGVTAATLSDQGDAFLAGGDAEHQAGRASS
jgi:hypothetical protein